MIFLTVLVLARTGGAVIRNLAVEDLREAREDLEDLREAREVEPGCGARNKTYELPTLSCGEGVSLLSTIPCCFCSSSSSFSSSVLL